MVIDTLAVDGWAVSLLH